MVAAVNQDRVPVARHETLRGSVLLEQKLAAESVLGIETVVIDLLVAGLLRQRVGVVLVRGITGPATVIATKLAHQQVSGVAGVLVSQDVENAAARMS